MLYYEGGSKDYGMRCVEGDTLKVIVDRTKGEVQFEVNGAK